MTATGGTTSTYISNGKIYKSHTFVNTNKGGGNSATFTVTDVGNSNQTVDVLVVGGGGGACERVRSSRGDEERLGVLEAARESGASNEVAPCERGNVSRGSGSGT